MKASVETAISNVYGRRKRDGLNMVREMIVMVVITDDDNGDHTKDDDDDENNDG